MVVVPRMLLTALLVRFTNLPWCFSHYYYIINEFKNWTEAQDYCRKYYVDLASFDNKEEHDQVVQTLLSGGYTDGVWIGLYDDRYSWRWSNGEKKMTYTNWEQKQPDSYESKESCVGFFNTGWWIDISCENLYFVLCYNATKNTTVLIKEKKTWSDALNYCRRYHTDLATIENKDENTKLKLLLNEQNVTGAFMGLYRDTWKWSDQSTSKFRAWVFPEPNNFGGVEFCAQLKLPSAQWADVSCSKKLRFVCGTEKKMQILRINMQSPLNLNVNKFNSTILQQVSVKMKHSGFATRLQQKLRELGLPSNTKLTWRTQPDGQIFHTLNETNTTNVKP